MLSDDMFSTEAKGKSKYWLGIWYTVMATSFTSETRNRHYLLIKSTLLRQSSVRTLSFWQDRIALLARANEQFTCFEIIKMLHVYVQSIKGYRDWRISKF